MSVEKRAVLGNTFPAIRVLAPQAHRDGEARGIVDKLRHTDVERLTFSPPEDTSPVSCWQNAILQEAARSQMMVRLTERTGRVGEGDIPFGIITKYDSTPGGSSLFKVQIEPGNVVEVNANAVTRISINGSGEPKERLAELVLAGRANRLAVNIRERQALQ